MSIVLIRPSSPHNFITSMTMVTTGCNTSSTLLDAKNHGTDIATEFNGVPVRRCDAIESLHVREPKQLHSIAFRVHTELKGFICKARVPNRSEWASSGEYEGYAGIKGTPFENLY